jgi:uncharacterized membrane protein
MFTCQNKTNRKRNKSSQEHAEAYSNASTLTSNQDLYNTLPNVWNRMKNQHTEKPRQEHQIKQ